MAIAATTWKFPRQFWTANTVELFERAAFYAVFIAVTIYLTDVVGFNDIEAAWISGVFSAGLYLLPPFAGAFADKIGFRRGIILAFVLLTIGYGTLGAFPYKPTVLPAILILMLGGSFVKSIITGTVAKSSDTSNRARAYSIFYGIVNVGSFTGKTVAYPLRVALGVHTINYYAAAMTALALVVVFMFYRSAATEGEGKTMREAWDGFVRILGNGRLLVLILIVSGFWIIQQQMYATMPKYVLRTVGASASPEWIANVNPLVVMLSVLFITQFMKKARALTSIAVGMLLMPLSALCMASSPLLQSITGPAVPFPGGFSAHPITVMLIAGIVLQGLAECFISPRYLEFFSLQAPRGEEGTYLGFSHLHSFFSSLLGFGISGYLLSTYCPDPATIAPAERAAVYDHASVLWYYFAAIGALSACSLFVYAAVVRRLDRKVTAPGIATGP